MTVLAAGAVATGVVSVAEATGVVPPASSAMLSAATVMIFFTAETPRRVDSTFLRAACLILRDMVKFSQDSVGAGVAS